MLCLSDETLQRVVRLLSQQDSLALTQTCKRIDHLSKPILWQHLYIKGRPGRNALRTASDPSKAYARFTKTLIVEAMCGCDVYNTFQLFADAIPLFNNVVELHLTFCRMQSQVLWKVLQPHFDDLKTESTSANIPPERQRPRCFPSLVKLVIHGAHILIAFGAFHPLTEFTSTIYMHRDDLLTLAETLTLPSPSSTTIQFLSLRIHPKLAPSMTEVLAILGETFPNVRFLHLLAPGAAVTVRIKIYTVSGKKTD